MDQTATTEQPKGNELRDQVLKAFKKSLKSDDITVQSTGATAIAKTMLSRLITDTDLLKQLVVAFFDPDTNANAHLRQILSYFLPVYCHSKADNAKRMVEILPAVVAKLATLRESLEMEADVEDDTGDGMVKLSLVGNMMLDWTDPRKIVGFAKAAGATGADDGASEMHFILADRVLDRLLTSQVNRDERKVLFSMLGKLHLPSGGCEGELLGEVLAKVQEAFETKVASDASSRNVLGKMRDLLLKQMNTVATAERGGGGAEETILETTEVQPGAEQTEINTLDDLDEEEEEAVDEDVTALTKTVRDTTIGATTIGAPDAEGTRVQLALEHTDMMDIDGDEYTEV